MFSAFAGGLAETVFVEMLLTIDSFIYKFISWLYGIYLEIANFRILTTEVYNDITSRIYIVVGVIALFMVAYSLLQSVINPDGKSLNNGLSLVKRLCIAFVVTLLVPTIFEFMYDFQNAVLSGNVIGSIFMGTGDDYEDVELSMIAEFIDDDGRYYYYCSDCDGSDLSSCTKYTFTDGAQITESQYDTQCSTGDGLLTVSDTYDLETFVQQQYGSNMAFSILNGFLYPSDGISSESIEVEASSYFSSELEYTYSCGVKGTVLAGAMILGSVAFTAVTFGTASVATAPVIVAAISGCVLGLGGQLYEDLTTYVTPTVDNYNWEVVSNYVSYTGEFEKIVPFSQAVNEGSMQYLPIVSTIAGGIVVYLLFSFILDLAIRVFKLAFYTIIAPIPIFMSVLPGNDKMLNTWAKIVMTTYAEVFVRVACLSGVAYFIKVLVSLGW